MGLTAGLLVIVVGGGILLFRESPPPESGAAPVAAAPPLPAEEPPPPVEVLLRITTDPSEAEVRVPGRTSAWTTPCEITDRELPAGTHQVEISKAGFLAVRETLTLRSGRPSELHRTLMRPAPPEPARQEPEPPGAAASPERLGIVEMVHPEYGIFVKLEKGARASVGDEASVVRKGQDVGRLRIERITAPEAEYPHGCAVGRPVRGNVRIDDEVRRGAR
jgi:hypothetical protein